LTAGGGSPPPPLLADTRIGGPDPAPSRSRVSWRLISPRSVAHASAGPAWSDQIARSGLHVDLGRSSLGLQAPPADAASVLEDAHDAIHMRRSDRYADTVAAGSARREPKDQLSRLEWYVELRAVADAVELDPVGLRQQSLITDRPGRPAQDLVSRAPDEPERACDPLGVEREAVTVGEIQQRGQGITAAHAANLMGEQLGRNVRVVGRGVRGRPPAPVGRSDDRVRVRCGRPTEVPGVGEIAAPIAVGRVAGLPAAGRRQRDDAPRAPAGGKLQRHVAAERVADDVRRLEPGRLHRALDPIGERRGGQLAVERGAAGVAGERRREDVVVALQRGQDELPGPPRVGDPVHADERRAGASSVIRGESRVHETGHGTGVARVGVTVTRETTTDLAVLDRLVQPRGKLIVDVGCAGGALVRRLAALGAEVVGVEVSMQQLAAAATEPGARYLIGHAQALPLDDASVDVVLFMRSLHHVPPPEMVDALREAARVLRAGGVVYVAEPLPDGKFFEVVSIVDDELEVRLAAQRALADASRAGLERVTTIDYDVKVEIAGLDALRARIVSVDPQRAATFDARADELARALGTGRCFVQPMRADLLRLAAQAGAAASS
jgi:SAM-dependent methyltransferase